jgi:ribulose-5-phosphate 4-epimerase/fuculose-1-phosphate aldolase
MDSRKLRTLRESVYRANRRLYEESLVVGTFGNASGIDREAGIVAIKPYENSSRAVQEL